MSKHTPGPWFYDSGAIWSDSQLDPENKPYVFRGEEPLAVVISRNAQDSHLIAAAPQMLEALEAIIKRFQPESHDAAGCMFKNCELCKAIAAIAAAKGEV